MRSSPASATVSIRVAKGRGLAPVLAALAVITTIVTMLTTMAPGAALARERRSHLVAAAKPAEPDKLTAPYAAALLMEPETGTVTFENNEHKPWPTASLAKMMIAMIVAEKLADGSLKPGDRIATSRNAAAMGGSQVYLKEGETFSLDDMMKAIMVHSANDASVAVAEYIGGSTEAFVQMMNREAARLGMKDTHYYSRAWIAASARPAGGHVERVGRGPAGARDDSVSANHAMGVDRYRAVSRRHLRIAQYQSPGAHVSRMRRAQDRLLLRGRFQRGGDRASRRDAPDCRGARLAQQIKELQLGRRADGPGLRDLPDACRRQTGCADRADTRGQRRFARELHAGMGQESERHAEAWR